MLIRWWFFSTCSFFGGKTELFFWDLETAVICWCWFDGDFYGDLMGHSWNIKRHIDIILIGLLKQGWNKKTILQQIDQENYRQPWFLRFHLQNGVMLGVPWWKPYLLVSLLAFYPPGNGPPFATQSRPARWATIAGWLFSQKKWWPEGIDFMNYHGDV